ncbi:MAG: 30S ribosomal protein S8 [Candidatus Omnitrophica bacterium]|nr:30S ribosomal protein S8 [Candidatus Omnitrophota bacterium]
MSITDPIADMATLIRNAGDAGKEKVDIKASKVNEEILQILKSEKFIQTYKKIDDNKQGTIRVYLRYDDEKKSIIKSIRRISKPGLKVYKNKKEILPVLGGLGINIISTSKGILSDNDVREKGLGGEVMLEVW